MGMFDSVFATCPKCNEKIKFQSKAGDCELGIYKINSVPTCIAEDLNGDEKTCTCGHIIKLNIKPSEPIRVEMIIDDNLDYINKE